jgi:hypothetical protein
MVVEGKTFRTATSRDTILPDQGIRTNGTINTFLLPTIATHYAADTQIKPHGRRGRYCTFLALKTLKLCRACALVGLIQV